MEKKVRKETAASFVTQKDFEGHPGHRVPQERSVFRDSQGPRATEVNPAGMAWKDCLGRKVRQG